MADGELTPGRSVNLVGNTLVVNAAPVASLCVKKEIEPGQSKNFEFIISWYQPNRIKAWFNPNPSCCPGDDCCKDLPTVKNYYAKFGNALGSAAYLIKDLKRLEEESRKFVKTLNTGVLPDYVIEAVSTTITVIRSNTCFRIEDGTFYAWEGCSDDVGCCDGNCTHVWNYTQSIAFLFPEL